MLDGVLAEVWSSVSFPAAPTSLLVILFSCSLRWALILAVEARLKGSRIRSTMGLESRSTCWTFEASCQSLERFQHKREVTCHVIWHLLLPMERER